MRDGRMLKLILVSWFLGVAAPAFANVPLELLELIDQPQPTAYGLRLKAPDIAENGAVVAIQVDAFGFGDGPRQIRTVRIYACRSPIEPLAEFHFPESPFIALRTRVKIQRTSDVYAVGELNDGSLVYAKKEVKVTIGGCGGGGPYTPPQYPGADSVPEATTWVRSTLAAHKSRLVVQGQEQAVLRMESLRADVRIDGFRARVLLDMVYHNHLDGETEGVFQLRLPNNGTPYYIAFGDVILRDQSKSGLSQNAVATPRGKAVGFDPQDLELGPRRPRATLKEAVMVPRDDAARAYYNTVAKRVDPALVEWNGSGVYSVRVFPLRAGARHRIVLGYDVDLRAVKGGWQYQFNIPDDAAKADVFVHVNPGQHGGALQVTPQPTRRLKHGGEVLHYHNPAQRRLVFRLPAVRNILLQGSDAGRDYFAARIQPHLPANLADAGSPDAVFVLDTSLSSRPESFNEYVALLEAILEQNEDSIQRFAVLFFDVDARWWQPYFHPNQPHWRSELRRDLRALTLGGATDLQRALAAASTPAWTVESADSYRDVAGWDVFLLSDGMANWGDTDVGAIARALEQGRARRLFAYSTRNQGVAAQELADLATARGGAYFAVAGADAVAGAARAHRYTAWRLEGVEAAGAEEVLWDGSARDLYRGQHLLVAGRGRPTTDFLTLRLRSGARETRVQVPLDRQFDSPLAPRLYGQTVVEQLEAAGGAGRDYTQAYAGHFRIPRRTMSLLMLESEADYERYRIDTRRDFAKQLRGLRVAPLLAELRTLVTQRVRKYVTPGSRTARLTWLHDDWAACRMPTAEYMRMANFFQELGRLPDAAFQVARRPVAYTEEDRVAAHLEIADLHDFPRSSQQLRRHRLQLMQQAQYRAALRVVSNKVELAPRFVGVVRAAGLQALDLGYPDDAWRLFQTLDRIGYPWDDAYGYKARALAAMGKIDYAIAMYEAEVWQHVGRTRLSPWHAEYRTYLRRVYDQELTSYLTRRAIGERLRHLDEQAQAAAGPSQVQSMQPPAAP